MRIKRSACRVLLIALSSLLLASCCVFRRNSVIERKSITHPPVTWSKTTYTKPDEHGGMVILGKSDWYYLRLELFKARSWIEAVTGEEIPKEDRSERTK